VSRSCGRGSCEEGIARRCRTPFLSGDPGIVDRDAPRAANEFVPRAALSDELLDAWEHDRLSARLACEVRLDCTRDPFAKTRMAGEASEFGG
jgi:hypothetical protein